MVAYEAAKAPGTAFPVVVAGLPMGTAVGVSIDVVAFRAAVAVLGAAVGIVVTRAAWT